MKMVIKLIQILLGTEEELRNIAEKNIWIILLLIL